MSVSSHTIRAQTMRAKLVRPESKEVLISQLAGSEQAKDLCLPPNCNGYGRIRHFRRQRNADWVPDPLPNDPASKALGKTFTDLTSAQVFQIAGCNLSCWYCFVPTRLRIADESRARWFSPAAILDTLLAEADHPAVIDLSGGQPDLVPEWVPWIMEELVRRGLDKTTYLWSDDNLTTALFWDVLDKQTTARIEDYPNYGKVCCFKGFSPASVAFNTGAPGQLHDEQFRLFERVLSLQLDLYAYVTFTTPEARCIRDDIRKFVDRLQSLDDRLPLRTVPLEINDFTPVRGRLDSVRQRALALQFDCIDEWKRTLEERFSATDRATRICDVQLARGA